MKDIELETRKPAAHLCLQICTCAQSTVVFVRRQLSNWPYESLEVVLVEVFFKMLAHGSIESFDQGLLCIASAHDGLACIALRISHEWPSGPVHPATHDVGRRPALPCLCDKIANLSSIN